MASVRAGSWCPECSGCKRLAVEDCVRCARENNGKFISDVYTNVVTKYEWECEFGHRWKTKLKNIRAGKWCPICNASSGEKEVARILNNILKNTIIYRRYRCFDWLISDTTGWKLELDFYIPDFNIAIEFQGIQHFKPVDFSGKNKNKAKDDFEKRKARDHTKRRLLEKHGITLIEILYYEKDIEGVLLEKINNVRGK
jgi:hypothetical protein